MEKFITNSPRRVYVLMSLLLLLSAACLRVHSISQRSLWLDEAIAANISRGTLSHTVFLVRAFDSAPIVHPLILYVTEKASTTPFAVRMPSLLSSLLALIVMLCMARIPSVAHRAAWLSALMMTVSAIQIHYAQEVREYSLSVFYAALLLYCFLLYTSDTEGRHPLALYVALFVAPFVQYGLMLFSVGMLVALAILAFTGDRRRRALRVLIASCCLATGGVLSLFLTLRYQWGDVAWYLDDYYYTRGTSLVRFVVRQTHHLVTAFLPGADIAAFAVVGICFCLYWAVRSRIFPPLALLAFTSVGTVLVCAILHKYPYGPIRQCLFLSPVLCALAAVCIVQLIDRVRRPLRTSLFAGIVCVTVLSGGMQIRAMKPYAEIEDIQRILSALEVGAGPHDLVYIYPGAVPATDFYITPRDPRFLYGDYHQDAPNRYVTDILANADPRTGRLWLVFSHVYRNEDRWIVGGLSAGWEINPVLVAQGSSLYLARRRPVPGGAPSNPTSPVPIQVAEADVVWRGDSSWDWDIRNCSRLVCRDAQSKLPTQAACTAGR